MVAKILTLCGYTASFTIPFALVLIVASCATSPIPLGLPCSVGPFITDKGASTRWTRSEKEQLVVINETGEKLCRWKAPN